MKINFRYSRPYDEMLTLMSGLEYDEFQEVSVKKYIDELNSFWKEDGKKIIDEIERVSGLKFKADLECYVVKNMRYAAFSHPLTLRLDESGNIKATMIHELTHILLVQNSSKIVKLINKKFKEESRLKIHLPVLLIFKNVVGNLYGKEYLERSFDMERDGELEKIWKIVKSINFNKNIIAYLER